jgi:hypothetical protein
MNRRKTIILAALFLVAARRAPLAAGPGSAFGEGLRLTNTAWAIGMSDALVAAGGGVSAISLNPAGVLDSALTTVHLTHAVYVAKLSEDYFAYSQRLPLDSAFGIGIHGIYDSSTPRTLEDASGNFAGETGKFPLGFAVGGAAYAMNIGRLIPVIEWLRPVAGASMRVVWQQVDRESWVGITTDYGLKARPGGGFTIAGVLQNAGAVKGPAGLPLQWVTGIAWQGDKVFGQADKLLVEVDSPIAVDRGFSFRAGAEYQAKFDKLSFAVRGGWKQENEVPGAPGISAGFGFRWFLGRTPWGMDYAYVPWGIFGGEHVLSATLGILPTAPPDEQSVEPRPQRVPPEVFYPLKGEKARYDIQVTSASEVSAVLLDADGKQILTLVEKRIVWSGSVEVAWDGYLANGMMAEFDHTFRILIQVAGQTWYKDVVPKRE